MNLLSLRGLTRHYGPVPAVDNVSLDIAAGGRTAIVGPSGSGKTTLLRLIAGFENPDAGSITLGETVLADETHSVPAYKRGIGYVAQEGALFPHLTVAANIGFGLDSRGKGSDPRIAELMDLVGLPISMHSRRPHELSGGQQQRVALARALARQPKLMLLDEPFSALDAALRENMREMMGDVLGRAGVTTILVTHDQAEALSFADHLAIMRDGAIVQSGPPVELYRHPRDIATARFLGEAVILDAELAAGEAHCHLGRLGTDAPGRNGSAQIMLRPEQILISDAPSMAASTGKVVSRSYRGSSCRLLIAPVHANGAASTHENFAVVTSNIVVPETGALVQLNVVGTAHVFD